MLDPKEHPKVVLLLSGGLDSAVLLYQLAKDGIEIYPMYVQFGDNKAASEELSVAVYLLKKINMTNWHERLRRVTIPPFPPCDGPVAPLDSDLAKGYIPGRNTILCSFAYQYAVQVDADVCIGVTASDAPAFPDCRPEWAREMRRIYTANNKAFADDSDGPELLTPLIDLDRSQIRTLAQDLGVPVDALSRCYTPLSDGSPCGECEGCHKDD